MDNQFHRKEYLPEWYVLSDFDVICGRGRTCFYHEGNIRFRQLVETQLERYIEAKTKTDKTVIIYEIIDYIRKSSPTSGAGFVKLDKTTNRYFEIGDFVAREKTSQAFRDLLHEKYKSSNANKRFLRKVLKTNCKNDDGIHGSPKNRPDEASLEIDAMDSDNFTSISRDVKYLFSISSTSLEEECNNFPSYHSILPSSTVFGADPPITLQQTNTLDIFPSTQQILSSSLNFDFFQQYAHNLVENNIADTLPNESIESPEAVLWEQNCEQKATICSHVHYVSISDLSTSASHQRLGTPTLSRENSFSHSTAYLPLVDNSAIYAPSILGVPPAQVPNDIKTNVDHQIDPYIADVLYRHSFNFYNL